MQFQAEGMTELRPFFNFARIATPEVVPVLLELLTKQDEDAADDEYNVSRAAYQCLQLYSARVQGLVIGHVLQFVEANLRHENWRLRDAAVSAFGAIMEGPEFKQLDPLVKQALPVLVGMMDDKNLMVKDSAAYALGRICECCGQSIDPQLHLPSLIQALFSGLKDSPKMASSCCWALMNLADRFGIESESEENSLSKYFKDSVSALLAATERYKLIPTLNFWGLRLKKKNLFIGPTLITSSERLATKSSTLLLPTLDRMSCLLLLNCAL